jgi:ethanolamine ammonia-lyase small subunit
VTTPVLWRDLRRFTAARVGLGRVGHALPTAAHLDFQEAHARARDAVWSALDVPALQAALPGARVVASAAPDRRAYLLRPDLGRRLAEGTRLDPRPGCFAIVVADGLCASGVQAQAAGLVAALIPGLERAGWVVAPPVIATQARVAIGDEIGQALGAAMVAVLIGERPGLSSLDSMGIYLTHGPRAGRHDAERNCISNIRPGGISTADAAAKLLWLVAAARRLGLTGVGLKDEQPSALEGEAQPVIGG